MRLSVPYLSMFILISTRECHLLVIIWVSHLVLKKSSDLLKLALQPIFILVILTGFRIFRCTFHRICEPNATKIMKRIRTVEVYWYLEARHIDYPRSHCKKSYFSLLAISGDVERHSYCLLDSYQRIVYTHFRKKLVLISQDIN